MKRTQILLSILLILTASTLFMSCEDERTVEPKAEVGWNGKDSVIRVTDDHGQQFLMNYLLYQQLFNHNNGGYNAVIHHYYDHPNAPGYYKSTTPVVYSRPIRTFSNSYHVASKSNSVYRPTASSFSRVTKSPTYIKSSYSRSYSPSRSRSSSFGRSFSSGRSSSSSHMSSSHSSSGHH